MEATHRLGDGEGTGDATTVSRLPPPSPALALHGPRARRRGKSDYPAQRSRCPEPCQVPPGGPEGALRSPRRFQKERRKRPLASLIPAGRIGRRARVEIYTFVPERPSAPERLLRTPGGERSR
ncbi:hypothetical protein RJ55_08642 [Drechmeria coniospora]|nr:hypothetical protein RJ55_08642 [Drechmeria coniospora]